MFADLEGISTQTVPESKKLLAETTLAHIKHKKEKILELDDAIGAKIEVAQEFEEEITNADTYQMSLDECIAFLSEFIRKAGMLPASSTSCWSYPTPIHSAIIFNQRQERTTQQLHNRPSIREY